MPNNTMEEKDYRFRINFVTTYEVEVRARYFEEAKEKAEDVAMDMFNKDWNEGEIDPSYFALEVEEDEYYDAEYSGDGCKI